MKITSKKQLEFFIKADRMINRGYFEVPVRQRMKNILSGDKILSYLYFMRSYSYSLHGTDYNSRFGLFGGVIRCISILYNEFRFRQMGLRLGFSMGPDVFDNGLRLTHYGTMIVGTNNTIGKFALIQPSTCIEGQANIIGDNFYLATGARVVKKVEIADNVIVGANAVLNRSVGTPNVMLVGIPAKVKGAWKPWWKGSVEESRVEKIERLRNKMGL